MVTIYFNQYGDRYFLSRVQIGDSGYMQAPIKTRAEREAARNVRVLTPAGQ